MKRPTTAMILAAGLGTRMRPLTLDRPKALVEVAGRALVDHVLDRLAAAGVERVVVNVHAFADLLEAHLRRRSDLEILISDERGGLLETGGGLKAARPLLGDAPILVANVDTLWTEPAAPAIEGLLRVWDEAAMDDILLLAPVETCSGFDGPGDFYRDGHGRLDHRGGRARAPFAYAGVHMLRPGLIDDWPSHAHGIFGHWMAMAAKGRLFGAVMDGTWMHVGDPAAVVEAEARIDATAARPVASDAGA
jgi:MurNAc alpha-1-phosphate uridylyltransferase